MQVPVSKFPERSPHRVFFFYSEYTILFERSEFLIDTSQKQICVFVCVFDSSWF